MPQPVKDSVIKVHQLAIYNWTLSDSKSGITRGEFKKPEDYSVDLLCYYVPSKIMPDSANIDKIHIDFHDEEETIEEEE